MTTRRASKNSSDPAPISFTQLSDSSINGILQLPPTHNYQNWKIGANHDRAEVAQQQLLNHNNMTFSQFEYRWTDFERNGIKFSQGNPTSTKIPNEISSLVGMMTNSVAHTLLMSSMV